MTDQRRRRGDNDEEPMSNGVTQGQFFEMISQLKEQLQDNHRRQREHVDEQTERILSAFRAHEVEDRKIEIGFRDRLMTIETERGYEKRTASKHGAIAGSIVAGLVIGLIESIKKLLVTHP